MNTRSLHVLVVVCSIVLLTPNLCSAQLQTILVGPDGQYATVLEALVEVLTAPQAVNVIKVQAGVNSDENLLFPASWTTGTISISGSWDASFQTQSFDPADTVISGGLTHRVIDIKIAGGSVIQRHSAVGSTCLRPELQSSPSSTQPSATTPPLRPLNSVVPGSTSA